MYFITTKRMLEVCFSAHPNIQYRTLFLKIFTKLVTYFTGFVRALLCNVYKNIVPCRNSTILELNLARCLLVIKVNKPKGENHNERGI